MADRLVRSLAAVAVVADLGAGSIQLRPETAAAWTRYVAAVDARRAAEERTIAAAAAGPAAVGTPRPFFVLEFGPAAAAERRDLLDGQVVVREIDDEDEALPEVPSATVSHWRGGVFIPGVTLARLLHGLQTEPPPAGHADVVRSAIVSTGHDGLVVAVRVKRTKIVTVVYDTEHRVRFTQLDSARATSVSTATKIAEVANPDTPDESRLPEGRDHGFLWRLTAYWRYEAVSGGVIAECESISLSRPVPAVVRYVASPIITHAARDAMADTLTALRDRFAR